MTMKKAMGILIVLAIVLVLELAIYFGTGMNQALTASGLAMVAAYKFLWLTVLTAVLALLAPVGALIEGMTEKKDSGCVWWIVLTGVVMLGFTAISFLQAPSGPSVAAIPQVPAAATPLAPVPPPAIPPAPPVSSEGAGPQIVDSIEMANAKVAATDAETLTMAIDFKNKSSKIVTELDYTFAYLVQGKLLLKLNMREGIYILPGETGQTTLTWKKSNFKENPQTFDEMSKAVSADQLKVVVTPTRAQFEDGSETVQR